MTTGFTDDHIQDACNIISAFWQGARTAPILSLQHEPHYRQALCTPQPDVDAFVRACAEVIRQEAADGEPFVLPCVSPDFGTVSTARLFGGEVVYPKEGGNVHIEPIACDAEELSGLSACAFEDSDYQAALDIYRAVCREMETDNIFLRSPDFQGPMNTLALLMDQEELMCAFYEDPDAIHQALDRITDILIDYIRRFRKEAGVGRVIGNIWPYVYLPDDQGIAITQDMMPLLSAEIYRDFEIPYLKRINDAFGGVFIHCCGQYAHQLPVLKDAGLNLFGLEFHDPYTRFEDVFDVFGDSIAYVGYCATHAEGCRFGTYPEFAAHLLAVSSGTTRFFFPWVHEWGDAEALRALLPGQKEG